MLYRSLVFFSAFVLLAAPRLVSAAVVINEVLFDPAGADTGLEKIELYNPDDAAAAMGGWELYPDGIGYFAFPSGFSLPAKSFVVVHLRTSGTNPAGSGTANLYHSAASSNMGNSSGSLALFKPGGRSKDTIIDFVRYHKAGAGERKTWETAAADAGLWIAGQFVNIASLGEGNSVSLTSDGVRGSAAEWKVSAAPSIGAANAASASSSSAPPAAAPTPPASSGPAPTPSLGADAGPDVTALAGAAVNFRGMAFGLDGAPLPEVRFLWNFGDGSLGEGRAQDHIYRFPGIYQVNLSVSSGYYAGADWRVITVIMPALAVSEVMPGADGFVEISNASEATIDLGGLTLTDDRANTFSIPSRTAVGPKNLIVLANAVTGLDPHSAVTLSDGRGRILDTASFRGAPPAGASWERASDDFRLQLEPTPGRGLALVQATAPSTPPSAPVVAKSSPPPSAAVQLETSPTLASASALPPPRAVSGPGKSRRLFLAASALLGIVAAVGFILAKRKLTGESNH